MAMINSAAWNGQDQSMSSASDDDFQQFFDIGMSNMGDSMQFDFHDFNTQNGPSMMQSSHRDTVDTPMSDASASSVVAHNNMGVHSQLPTMTSAPSHPTVPSQTLPHQHTPSDTISEIDAQIQFLQHQRREHQRLQHQRLQQQQAAFYAPQQQQRNIVPPTPQSLEMQAASQFYTSQDHGHPSGMFEGYQQIKEQQDVRLVLSSGIVFC
jgi:hypothetical protein